MRITRQIIRGVVAEMTQIQQQIAATLSQVPYAHVVSYGQLADLAGLPGRARLVGKVLGELNENLNLPWHRVVRSDGKLAFAPESDTACLQRHLLEKEGISVSNHRVSMKTYVWRPDLYQILNQLKY